MDQGALQGEEVGTPFVIEVHENALSGTAFCVGSSHGASSLHLPFVRG